MAVYYNRETLIHVSCNSDVKISIMINFFPIYQFLYIVDLNLDSYQKDAKTFIDKKSLSLSLSLKSLSDYI